MKLFEEKITLISPSKVKPLATISSGLATQVMSAENQSTGHSCALLNKKMRRQEMPGVSSHPASCNYDDILDCCTRYPLYQQYFREKISKIDWLQDLLEHPEKRAKGETKYFILYYLNHFKKQIQTTAAWLLKKDYNGKIETVN